MAVKPYPTAFLHIDAAVSVSLIAELTVVGGCCICPATLSRQAASVRAEHICRFVLHEHAQMGTGWF
jgi:hypothetical protein